MKLYKFTVVFEPEEDQKDTYCVYVPALQGCHSFGESLNEAHYNIREATELYLECLLEEGVPIPKDKKVKAPKGAIVEEIVVGVDFSVKTGFERRRKMAYA